VGENLEVLDHVTVGVSNLEASTRFYDAALLPLGVERHGAGGFVEWGDFSIAAGRPATRNARIVLAGAAAARFEDPEGTVVEVVPGDARGSIRELTLAADDLDAARRFYAAVVRPLGLDDDPVRIVEGEPTRALHLAFAAATNADVDAFWRAGSEAGYISNGDPGERPQYHPGYYGAFLLDPAGNNVEAVCHNR
jgi:catechol 2,3-dioxygenase-like lactoylglutathione lyase family enzyme